ncbi:MAG: 5'-nucleotidase C-terminal domain-containing protein [Deltaproteobacteria bacterium]|nr:5'-nucleotidase C-terminal domain-containing protein [Deltaproteobacteria bacterium]
MHLKRSLTAARLFLALLLLVWVAGCTGHLPGAGGQPAPVTVTILFFNDLHGNLLPFEIKSGDKKQEVGGIARMAALVRDIRAENSRRDVRTLVLVAGDILQGTPMSTVFRGEPDIECLNAMGVDAMTVGNHEFDFGLENFIKLRERAAFPFLSANILEKESGRALCPPLLTIPLRDGLALTVIGVTTEEFLSITEPGNVARLGVTGALSAVRQAYEQVHTRGPVVILSHNKHRIDREIAAALPDLAAIIGGHDQVLLSPYEQVGSVPIFQAFERGIYLGRIDLRIDPASGKVSLVNYAYLPITAEIAPDPQVAAIVAAYQEKLGSRFREVIGRAETLLNGERGKIRYEETALGDFVADIMASHTGAPIALVNAGAMRTSIQKGPVTVEDVFRTVPFPNELVVIELTGTEIEQALQRAVSGSRPDEDGGFLQVSGIAFEVKGRTAVNIRVGADQQPLQPRTVYRVAVPDFLANGGDRYTLFKGKEQIKTGLPLRELIVDTIRRRGVITAREEGRIRRLE